MGEKPWTYEFNKYGGYDYMTASYAIKDANGNKLFEIDTGRYFDGDWNNWDSRHSPCPAAEEIAKIVCGLS